MPRPEYRALQPSLTHADLERKDANSKKAAERQAKIDKKTHKEKVIRSRQIAGQAVIDRLAILESRNFPDSSTVEIVKVKGVPVLRKPKNMAPIMQIYGRDEAKAYLKVLKVRSGYLIPPTPSADEASGQEVLWIGRRGHTLMGEPISKKVPESIIYSIPRSDDSFYFVDRADSFDARHCLAVTRRSLSIVNPDAPRWQLNANSFDMDMAETIDTLNRAAEHLGGIIERHELAELTPLAV